MGLEVFGNAGGNPFKVDAYLCAANSYTYALWFVAVISPGALQGVDFTLFPIKGGFARFEVFGNPIRNTGKVDA